MSAFEESQDTQENPGSQDLFQELDREGEAGLPEGVGKQLLKILKEMDSKLDKMAEDIGKLQSSTKKTFRVDTCSFKKKFNIYLKDRFSSCPWINTHSDAQLKSEMKRHLKNEGFAGNGDAIKVLSQWASSRFTDFRNQLRRRIINEIKAGTDLEGLAIEEFAEKILGTYCNVGQDVCSQDRIYFALVLRSFLHKKKFLIPESDTLECYTDFWVAFKEYHSSVYESEQHDKWVVLKSLDAKRRQKRQQKENEK